MRLTRANAVPVLGEFLGTTVLVLVALSLSEITSVSYFVATSVAAALGVVYMMFSGLSGAHVNPAITFGMWTARRIRTLPAIAYIVAQLIGGFVAWALYQYFANHSVPGRTTNFTFSIFLAEAIGTIILSMGFAAAVSRGLDALESALTYATSLFVGIIVASTAAAGFLNPAVALGLHSFNAVYILGPLVGALIGINLYGYLFAPESVVRLGLRRKAAAKK